MVGKNSFVLLVLSQLIISGQAPVHAESLIKKLSKSEIPELVIDDADRGDWEAGKKSELIAALNRQVICKNPKSSASLLISVKSCQRTLTWFQKKILSVNSLHELYKAATEELEWYQSTGSEEEAAKGSVGAAEFKDSKVLYTGYYSSDIRARLKPDSVFKYPIYRTPPKEIIGKYSRAQIEAGALKGLGLEIAYAADPLDPYFVQVQGSGILYYIGENGNIIGQQKISNSGQNGKPYVSLRKVMLEAGIDEKYATSMQGIRQYFKEHPEQWTEFSNKNPSYVFFAKTNKNPQGAGAEVTPKHSIAVDATYIPMGAVALINTVRPAAISGDHATAWKPFSQFALAQDIGGAIKSLGHVDLYYGYGDYAKVAAGRTKHKGNLYFVVAPEGLK